LSVTSLLTIKSIAVMTVLSVMSIAVMAVIVVMAVTGPLTVKSIAEMPR
jgi:hypothetical protein